MPTATPHLHIRSKALAGTGSYGSGAGSSGSGAGDCISSWRRRRGRPEKEAADQGITPRQRMEDTSELRAAFMEDMEDTSELRAAFMEDMEEFGGL
jgi:hypothetical protein